MREGASYADGLQAAVIFRLFTCTQLASVIFVAAILLVDGLLPLGLALLALANPYLLEHPQMTMGACVAIVLRYVLSLFSHEFKPKATRISVDATGFHVVVEPDFAVLQVGKKEF
ncbi:MAG: hypothetical protein ACK52V_12555 [Betaproteobacteria bacterium]|nr:hypothetical protein [Rubrivivax sp.]